MNSRHLLSHSEASLWPAPLPRTILFGIGGLLLGVHFYDLYVELGNSAYPIWASLAGSVPGIGLAAGVLALGAYVSAGSRAQIYRYETARGCLVGFLGALVVGLFLLLLRQLRGGAAPMVYMLASVGTFAGMLVGYYRAQDKRVRRELSSITENVSEGIYRSTAEEGLVFANQAFIDMFGYSGLGELREAGPEELHADPSRRAELIEKESQKGELRQEEVRYRRKDGSTFVGLLSTRQVEAGQGEKTYFDGAISDITERKKIERQLREQETRLRGLTNSIPGVVYQFYARPDGTQGVHFVSDHAKEVLGISADEESFYDRFMGQVPSSCRDAFLESIERAVENEEPWRFETPFEKPPGEEIWVLGASTPEKRGEELVYNVVLLDITDRKEMEGTLREREALLQSITDHISEGIYRSDPERGIVYANEAFIDMFGYDSLEEVQEVDSSDLYAYPNERKRLLRRDDETLDQVEVTFQRKDGTTFVGLLSSRAVRDEAGTVEYYDGVITDITERKEYEEQLTYRYELEREIVDVSTQFINTSAEEIDETIEQALGAVGSFVGADRSYVFLVDKEAQTTSNTHEWCAEGTESHQPDLQDIPYDAMPWFMERMHHRTPLMTAVGDLPDEASRLQSILEDGHIESLVVLPMTQGDTLVGFVGFDAVETEREWEQDTVMILRVLSGAIANALQRKQMEEDMIAARQEAEEANRLKSAFLANMSHEIRTPLTSIIGFAEALGTEVAGLDLPEGSSLSDYAGLIEEGGKRLLKTLEGVLNLSKLEAGKMDLSVEPVDLGAQAQRAAEELRPKAEEKGLTLEVTVSEDEPGSRPTWARADEGGVQIVLQNLLSNAIKYTEEGGVEVRVYQKVETSEQEAAAVLEVEDSGIGMEPEMAEDLFEPFRQASEGLGREYEGTGVGLAVMKRAVEEMNGSIDVETQKGEGSRFTVRLPRAEESASEGSSSVGSPSDDFSL